MIHPRLKSKNLLVTFLFCKGTLTAFCQLPICPVPNPPGFVECEVINCIVCDLNGISGSTVGYGTDPDGDLGPFFCGTVESVQYFEFYAAVPDMSITVTVSGCTVNSGIDLGLMPECDHPLLFCTPGDGTNSTTLMLNGLTVGDTYILVIDVDASSDCDFKISVDPPDGTTFSIPPNVAIEGDFSVCPGAATSYSIVPPIIANILWSLPPGAHIISQANSFNNIVVHWLSPGGSLCFTATAPCISNFTLCQNVTVTPIPPTVFPPVKICSEDAPYELPWGGMTYVSGTFSHTILSFLGCDSTLMQTVTILPANSQTLLPVELCEGDCLTKCGETFCGYGSFSVTCQSFLGCDSVINFATVPPNLVAGIQGGGSITCSNATVTLNAAPTLGIRIWSDSTGQQLGTANQLVVSTPGIYFLTVTKMLEGGACSLTDSIVIPLNTTPPTVVAAGAKLKCDTLPVFVHVDSLPGPATYTWSGPNGFTSNLQNPVVTELGTYIVTVVDLANGCSAKDTVLVKSCCSNTVGTLDSTLVTVCGKKDLMAGFHWDQSLGSEDSLVFILYSDPADPLGSILMYSDTALFPFVDSLQQLDSFYYVAAVVGQVVPDSTINFHSACWALSPAQPVRWASKPSITVTQGPDVVCKGDCLDLFFQFTGTPPFYFHFDITENGAPRFSQDVVSDTMQKTVTICPSAFIQPQGDGTLHFNVNFFQDGVCNCND